MRHELLILFLIGFGLLCFRSGFAAADDLSLPAPNLDTGQTFRQVLENRRTGRRYADKPVTKQILSQLLWAAQGITDKRHGFRTAPSAGALYPLEVYVVIQNKGCPGLQNGLYQYDPDHHGLKRVKSGDFGPVLAQVGYSQDFFSESPLCFVITAVPERTTRKYGNRGHRYIYMEVGHVGQNIQLQGTALNLSVGIAGAFRDAKLQDLLNLGKNEIPLYIMPVGYPRK